MSYLNQLPMMMRRVLQLLFESDTTLKVGRQKKFTTITASTTLDNDDSGSIIGVATDALTITLPAITAHNKGVTFTILNTGAEGNNIITVSPTGTDGIKGNISKSAGANADATTADGLVFEASGANGKDLVNTKTTANQGDRVTLISDGSADWWIVDGVGIWASEA